MAPIEWKPEFSVGNPSVDHEHQELVVGQMPTVISWADGPGWEFSFAAVGIVVPRIKSTYTGQSGIVKGYTS